MSKNLRKKGAIHNYIECIFINITILPHRYTLTQLSKESNDDSTGM